ncbi:hypothetical protein, partial [Pectobacterium betavasculorum]|uniref:hypothetical protein n=1 Tax=Pectobacterium betavasculorum TaxID=55207 RepID=UPI001ADF6F5C
FTVVHSSRLFISLRYGLVSAHTDCLIILLKSSATSSVARAAYIMLIRFKVKSLLTAFVESFSCHRNCVSLLPCQWRRIIGTSPPLTSAKCKIITEWGFFQQSAVKDSVMPDF